LQPAQARRNAEAFFAFDAIRTRFGHWVIVDRQSGTVHGWVELGKLDLWQGPSDEIGLSYVLFPESWSRGIATAAAGRLLRHAMETIGLACPVKL
jgi:RimJ/RimL family protein N-acetyltransferase